LGLLPALFFSTLACRGGAEVENVLVISVDTLRADRLGSYGSERGLTPALDRLAAEGLRFDRAISHSPWTTPSHMALFTSLQPSSHTVTQGWRELVAFQKGTRDYRILPRGVPTLAEILQSRGYRTLALTGGGTVAPELGFGRGFEVYLEDARKLRPESWSQLIDWIEDPDPRPFFIFFHTFEVHAPYLHIEEARPLLKPRQAKKLQAFIDDNPEMSEADLKRYLEERGLLEVGITSRLYDGGVRFTDGFLGRLFDRLRELGLWDRTLVVFLSDHGEEFADHRPQKFYNVHCDTLYDELLHVPLIFRVPGRFDDGRVVDGQVRLIDVAPTVLDLLEIPAPPSMQGGSLVERMAGGGEPRQLPAYGEALCIGPEWKSLRVDRYKYLVGFDSDDERVGIPGEPAWEKLFDLQEDPAEKVDLAARRPKLLGKMRDQLFRFYLHEALPVAEGEETLEVDAELEEKLRALGYLD
jgi:arylsulfatase A-like enzyme